MKLAAKAFLLILLTAPAAAQPQKKINVQLQMPPEMQSEADDFEAERARLTPQQQEILHGLIKQGAAQTMRVKLVDLTMNKENYISCARQGEEAEKQALTRAYLDYESYVQAQIEAGKFRVQQEIQKINFMDHDMLNRALYREDMLMLGAAQATQKLALQSDTTMAEICQDLKTILVKEFTPVPAANPLQETAQEVNFNMITLGEPQCHIGFRVTMNDGRTISATTLYRFDRQQNSGDLSFSFKFYAANGAQLPLRTGWISYGGVDSRAINYMVTENSALLLGVLPHVAVHALLGRMRNHPLRFAVQDTSGAVHGYNMKISPRNLNDMASCVAMLDRSKAANLQQAGFTLKDMTVPAQAAQSRQGDVYKLWEGRKDLPVCMMNNIQATENGRQEYSLMLVYSPWESTAAQKAPVETGLWLMGMDKESGTPIPIQEAKIEISAAGDPPAFDSAQAGNVLATGSFYKIGLGGQEFGRLFDNLREVPARVKVNGKEVNFPILPENDAVIFGNCVKNIALE